MFVIPQRELAVRAANSARDAHLAEFRQRAAVDDDEVLLCNLHGPDRMCGDARRAALMGDELAERLARHVDAGKDACSRRAAKRLAGRPGCAGRDSPRPRRARPPAPPYRPLDRKARRAPPGSAPARQTQLKPAVGQGHGEERMPAAVLSVLAHVDQRDLALVAEPRLEGRASIWATMEVSYRSVRLRPK